MRVGRGLRAGIQPTQLRIPAPGRATGRVRVAYKRCEAGCVPAMAPPAQYHLRFTSREDEPIPEADDTDVDGAWAIGHAYGLNLNAIENEARSEYVRFPNTQRITRRRALEARVNTPENLLAGVHLPSRDWNE